MHGCVHAYSRGCPQQSMPDSVFIGINKIIVNIIQFNLEIELIRFVWKITLLQGYTATPYYDCSEFTFINQINQIEYIQ